MVEFPIYFGELILCLDGAECYEYPCFFVVSVNIFRGVSSCLAELIVRFEMKNTSSTKHDMEV